tara:strand:+ start:192 stop:1436 length:1245 start_codon:yes stop_codon:yes gene_type:complete
MSGGLLDRVEEDEQVDQVIEEVLTASTDAGLLSREKSDSVPSNKEITMADSLKMIGLVMILPYFLIMWFDVYLPGELSSYLWLIIIATAGIVWWLLDIRNPLESGGVKMTSSVIVVAVTFLLILPPLLLGNVLIGTMSFGGLDYEDDGSSFEVTIRQNGGSGSHDAIVAITYGSASVYSSTHSFTIDQTDGYGKHGSFSVDTSAFYSGNALGDSGQDYSMTVTVGDLEWERTLDANFLTRTITGAETGVSNVMSSNCDEPNIERCLVGVGLSVSSGLSSAASPVAMPLANYNITATMSGPGGVAISYPVVEVTRTSATWDSNGGAYGSGAAIVGDWGSQLQLQGSVVQEEISLILKDDWESSDYGCYTLTVSITQDSFWGTETVTGSSEYTYSLDETEDDNEEMKDRENWIAGC